MSIILLTVVVSGCSSTIRLASPLDANRKVGGSQADVRLRSGAVYDATDVHVGLDSTRYINRTDNAEVHVATGDIESIRVTHHAGGALEGLMFGGLGGLALGLIPIIGPHSGGDAAGWGLVALGAVVIGASAGVVVGAIKGHDYTYIFPQDSSNVNDSVELPKRPSP